MSAIEWAGISEAGKVRPNNEDALSVAALAEDGARPLPESGADAAPPPRGLLFSVADGLGGQNAGEVASAMTVRGLPEELARLAPDPAPLTNRECGDRLEAAIRATNAAIRRRAVEEPRHRGMAATLSCLWLHGARGTFGQVGDSRLYRFRGDTLVQLSHDQSEVGRMVRSGALSEAEAKLTVGRNVVDQALGLRDDGLAPELDWVEVLPGDVFLLCSDGLVDKLHDKDLADCIRAGLGRGDTLAAIARALVTLAEESRSRDNITVLLVRAAPGPAAASAGVAPRGRGCLPALAALLVGCGLGALTALLLIRRFGVPFD